MRVNICSECTVREKVTLCCKCLKLHDDKITSFGEKFRRRFIGAEVGLVKIIEQYFYPFVQRNITRCNKCGKGECSTHCTQLMDKNGKICRACIIKEMTKTIKTRKERIEFEVDYSVYNLFV
jgi:hypothetical protein